MLGLDSPSLSSRDMSDNLFCYACTLGASVSVALVEGEQRGRACGREEKMRSRLGHTD